MFFPALKVDKPGEVVSPPDGGLGGHHSVPNGYQEPCCDFPRVSLPHTKPSSPRTMAL